jgi:hypothetical protein
MPIVIVIKMTQRKYNTRTYNIPNVSIGQCRAGAVKLALNVHYLMMVAKLKLLAAIT